MDCFEGLLLLRRRVRDRDVVRLCLLVQALMEDLADRLQGDAKIWSLAGLLHEVDREFTDSNPDASGKVAAEIVRAEQGPLAVADALARFRLPGPHQDVLTRALSAAVPAALIVLDLAQSRTALSKLDVGELRAGLDDPSVAPTASRTRIHALQAEGIEAPALLDQARASALRVVEDLFGA